MLDRVRPATLRSLAAARRTIASAPADAMRRSRQALVVATTVTLAALALTAVAPHDRTTWLLETAPVVAILAVLWVTRRRFPLTPLLYLWVALPLVMLCVGAHYTFERVPLGEWLQAAFGLERNPYDRLGHVVQGFVPALAAREVFLRASPLAGSRWLAPLAVALTLAISAAYELVEWSIVMVAGERARAFLGMQGDPWDAQWDMLCALAGAVLALALLGRAHDRALARLAGGSASFRATLREIPCRSTP